MTHQHMVEDFEAPLFSERHQHTALAVEPPVASFRLSVLRVCGTRSVFGSL